jgi:hypothetical protein
MARMVRNPKGELNHGSDPAAGPEWPSEAINFGAALPYGRQLRELLG